MDDQLYKRFVSLLPPSPFLRESASVGMVFLLLTTLMAGASLRSEYLVPSLTPYWKGTLSDTAILDALGSAAWFVALSAVAGCRLTKYRQLATSVPTKAYALLYPLAAAGCFAIIVAVVLMLNVYGHGNHRRQITCTSSAR